MDKVIDNIANEINNKYPTLKDFNGAGLYRMMQFYDTYKDNENLISKEQTDYLRKKYL